MPDLFPRVAVIGGGPAGLMAADTLAARGMRVALYDAMPSVGRKFLMAGRGGLNLSHSEPRPAFVARYGERATRIAPWLERFGPEAVRAWAHALGVTTFVGSSGRVFPTDMKAAPLLRAWLHRMREAGVEFKMRHRWLGWQDDAHDRVLRFATPAGMTVIDADAVVIALGGASWPRLGSDGAWVPLLAGRGLRVAPLLPANCGFETTWSEHFRTRCAGQPLKSVALAPPASGGAAPRWRTGEFTVTDTGIEGSLVYTLCAPIRDRLLADGAAVMLLDLLPALPAERVLHEVARPRGSRSMSTHLQSRLRLGGVKAAVLRECVGPEVFANPARLAAAIKAAPLRLTGMRPVAEAISTAGGVAFEEVAADLRATRLDGVFFAGEMLDWEAPTGGYLLTACLASGRTAADGVQSWLAGRRG
jgi:uncharacterized flavoprotein (TIGR03862 family)